MTKTTTTYYIAAVDIIDDTIVCHAADGKTSVDVTKAIKTFPGGSRSGDMYAVWKFPDHRPTTSEAIDTANIERPHQMLVHVSSGQLVELSDEYKLTLEAS